MSLTGEYLDRMYAGAADPGGFGSGWHEQRKYALTLAALPAASVDLSPAALAAARAGVPANVRLLQGGVPESWPGPGRTPRGAVTGAMPSRTPRAAATRCTSRWAAGRGCPQGGGELPAGRLVPGGAGSVARREWLVG